MAYHSHSVQEARCDAVFEGAEHARNSEAVPETHSAACLAPAILGGLLGWGVSHLIGCRLTSSRSVGVRFKYRCWAASAVRQGWAWSPHSAARTRALAATTSAVQWLFAT